MAGAAGQLGLQLALEGLHVGRAGLVALLRGLEHEAAHLVERLDSREELLKGRFLQVRRDTVRLVLPAARSLPDLTDELVPTPGKESVSHEGIEWRYEHDVLARETRAHTLYGETYDGTHGTVVTDHYEGHVGVSTVDLSKEEQAVIRPLFLLTMKPTLYVANVAEVGGFVKSSPEERLPDLQWPAGHSRIRGNGQALCNHWRTHARGR